MLGAWLAYAIEHGVSFEVASLDCYCREVTDPENRGHFEREGFGGLLGRAREVKLSAREQAIRAADAFRVKV